MVWTVRTQFWGLQPWPALCVRSCSYSTSFRKRKRRKSSFPECWLCSSHCSQWFTWLVSFKCHYHAVNQKLLCLFLRWTAKRRFRKVKYLPRHSAINYWNRNWTPLIYSKAHVLCPTARCLSNFCSFWKLVWIRRQRLESGAHETLRQGYLGRAIPKAKQVECPAPSHPCGVGASPSCSCHWGLLTWKH